MIVDFHVHVWEPRYIPLKVRRYWAAQAALRKDPASDPEEILPRVTVGVSDPGGSNLIAALDRNGIDRASILAVDYGPDEPEHGVTPIPEVLREYAAIVRSSNDRLDFFGSVDPRRPDALELAVEALDDLGARGLKFYPPAGIDPGGENCFPLYQALVERDAPAVVHTAIVPGPFDNRFASPLLLSRTQARFPELRLVLAHSGYPAWWEEAVAIAAAHPRTYLELSLWQNAAERDWKTVSRQIVDAVARLGADRVVFGSDSMFGPKAEPEIALVRRWIDRLFSLVEDRLLAAEQLNLIMCENALNLLDPSRR